MIALTFYSLSAFFDFKTIIVGLLNKTNIKIDLWNIFYYNIYYKFYKNEIIWFPWDCYNLIQWEQQINNKRLT